MKIAIGASAVVAATVAGCAIAGCASDGRRERAYRSVELAAHALDLVDETSGSEALEPEARAAIDPARAAARRWTEHAHEALERWPTSDGRSLAFETIVPCLGRALGTLRERLAAQHRRVPEPLRQAEALARTATEGRCARRRPRGARDPEGAAEGSRR